MKRETLGRVLDCIEAKRHVVLITDLDSGQERLLERGESGNETELANVETALRLDRPILGESDLICVVDTEVVHHVIDHHGIFESINERDLKLMHKASNLLPDTRGYKQTLQILRDHGIQSWAAFTLGHENDTKETIKKTVDFAIKSTLIFAVGKVCYHQLIPDHKRCISYKHIRCKNCISHF